MEVWADKHLAPEKRIGREWVSGLRGKKGQEGRKDTGQVRAGSSSGNTGQGETHPKGPHNQNWGSGWANILGLLL